MTGGVHRYLYHGNWKMQVENLIDMYHPAYSHESSSAKGGQQFSRREGDKGGIQFFEKRGKVKSMDGLERMRCRTGTPGRVDCRPWKTCRRITWPMFAAGRKARSE